MNSHYCVIAANKGGMGLLRSRFPNAQANEMNVVLFSTSGIHGHYGTIEDCEAEPELGVTFQIIEPRRCRIIYGNCYPQDAKDFEFLRALRKSSKDALAQIGEPTTQEVVKDE